MQKLKISESLLFAESVIDRANKSTDNELLNALFHLALYGVYATCDPETDLETRRVLALYQVEEALTECVVDVQQLFSIDIEPTEKPIIQ